jgi:hypothetical protein
VGRVTVHLGDGTGVFEEAAYATFHGEDSNQELGNAVAACDVNGDGLDDLIASDNQNDDATDTSRAGSIKVWLQQVGGGFPLFPIVRPGVRLDGSWTPVDNGRLGETGLVAGDVDHDGLCDVAASIDGRSWSSDESGPGFVLVWGGDANDGVTADPIRVLHPDGGDTGVRFGRYLAIGDADGVTGPAGLPDDLFVGARGYDGDAGTTNTAGGAFLYLGGGAAPLESTLVDADWSMQGSGGNDLVGEGLAIAANGDLLVAARGENEVYRVPGGSAFTPGAFTVDSPPAGLVLTPTPPTGMDASLFGLTVASFGDGVFATSRYDEVAADGSTLAIDARGLHGVKADGTTTTWTIGAPSGMEYGRSPVLYDVDGDGTDDVVLGGPEAPNPLYGGNAGRVRARTASGWTTVGDEGPTWGTNDRRGRLLSVGNVDGAGSPDLLELAWTDSRPDDPGLDAVCGANGRNSAGHLAVHVDGADAASLFWWPPENNARPESVASGLDADGDGFEDVFVGLSNDTVAMVYGQAAPPSGQTAELCREAIFSAAGGDFGFAVAAVGDLDGDGCDEVAVGAPNEDLVATDAGVVRILWGWSAFGACARSAPEATVLAMDSVRSRLGTSLAGGVDVTNDGVPDLAVGGTTRDVGSDRIGDALLIPGDFLAGLASHPVTGGVFPDGPVEAIGPPLQPNIGSVQPSSDFGSSIALIRGSGGGRWVAVGMPEASQASQSRSGAVAVYAVSNGALESAPSWWISGESLSNDSGFGEALATFGDQLVIGVPGSHAEGNVHVGGACVAPF